MKVSRSGQHVSPSDTTVAFIGLGIMGLPMASNLLDAGYSLRVHNRSRSAVDRLKLQGAVGAETPADAASGADVVILMLPDSPEVEAVIRDEGGVLEGATQGAVVIDMSTISPDVTRNLSKYLAALGIDMLDAPVSGGQMGAATGELTIMVGGDAIVYDRCLPLLNVLGSSVNRIGDIGAGQVAKACNQIVVACTIQAVGEALTLALNSGVDPGRVRSALLGGFAGSKVLDVHGQRIIDRAFEPGFRASLHRKDLGIALAAGAISGTMLPTTALVAQLFEALLARGGAEADHSALVTVIEAWSSQFKSEQTASQSDRTVAAPEEGR